MGDTQHQALLKKKNELEDRLQRIRNDLAGKLDADLEEQAVQLENRDVLLEIARVTESELEQINRKLSASD